MAGKSYRLIVFDWDGTLSDSCAVIIEHLSVAARETGLEAFDRIEARALIGLSKPDMLVKLYPGLDNRHLSDTLEKYRYYHAKYSRESQLFPHVVFMLEQCRSAGILVAIATGCGRLSLNHGLEQTGLHEVFCHTRTADECYSKPHPQMLEELMAESGVLASETLMLGDNPCDMALAKNADVAAVGVDFGNGLAENLLDEGALAVIDDWRQLSEYVAL